MPHPTSKALLTVSRLALLVQLGCYLLITAVALTALRIGVQAALMDEELDPDDPTERLTCPHCDPAAWKLCYRPSSAPNRAPAQRCSA